MASRSEIQWRTYHAGDALPGQARELLGDGDVDRFAAHDPTDVSAREPVCIAAVDEQGQWLAAALVLLEQDEKGGGERVASIHQLVVTPGARGQGLAGRLIRRAMQVGREADAVRLRSTAGWGCPDHLAMYDRLHFDRLNARELPYLVSKPLDR